MIEDIVITIFLWIAGLYYLLNTEKVRKAALAIQNKYPKAFPTRLPERFWYPTLLRVGAVICLIGAALTTLRLTSLLR